MCRVENEPAQTNVGSGDIEATKTASVAASIASANKRDSAGSDAPRVPSMSNLSASSPKGGPSTAVPGKNLTPQTQRGGDFAPSMVDPSGTKGSELKHPPDGSVRRPKLVARCFAIVCSERPSRLPLASQVCAHHRPSSPYARASTRRAHCSASILLQKLFDPEELKTMKGVDGIDPAVKEKYLSEQSFQDLFGMDAAAFAAQPLWRRQQHKKKVGLF